MTLPGNYFEIYSPVLGCRIGDLVSNRSELPGLGTDLGV